MVDVLFGDRCIRLSTSGCQTEKLTGLSLVAAVLCSPQGEAKERENDDRLWHKNFACFVSAKDGSHERIVEDHEPLQSFLPDGNSYYIKVEECPVKYELLRRPELMFRKATCKFIHEYYSAVRHDEMVQAFFRYKTCLDYREVFGKELRVNQTLHWQSSQPSQMFSLTSSAQKWKEGSFLLKADDKLGGVLMYSLQHNKFKCDNGSGVPSSIHYFIFAILIECDIFYCVKKPDKESKNVNKKTFFFIIFKPKADSSDHGISDYLSINKKGSVKYIRMDNRNDFNCWLSAIRLAKHGEALRTSFNKTNIKDNLPVVIDDHPASLPVSVTETAGASPSFGSFLSRLRGNKSRWQGSSSSWSESLSSSPHMSQSSRWSLLSSASGQSNTSSTPNATKKTKPVASDSGTDCPNEEKPMEDDEPIFVPIDRSSGEPTIVTDPKLIKQIKEEESYKNVYRRYAKHTINLVGHPWFTTKTKFEVDALLTRTHVIDGYFVVRNSEYRDTREPLADTFTISVVFEDTVQHFRIIQRRMFDKMVFTLDDGSTNFSDVPSLIDFYQLNKSTRLPCFLTEHPQLME